MIRDIGKLASLQVFIFRLDIDMMFFLICQNLSNVPQRRRDGKMDEGIIS